MSKSVSLAAVKTSKNDGMLTAERVLRGIGKPIEIRLEADRFKLGSLDTMLLGLERITKCETMCETFLKRTDKAYQDLVPEKTLASQKLESKDLGSVTLEKFLTQFVWDDIRFPRSSGLFDQIRAIEEKLESLDKNMKNRTAAFSASRAELSAVEKKDTAGALPSREATDIVFELLARKSPTCNPQVFVNSRYLCSVLVILAKDKLEEFTRNYESISESVVPGSLVVLGELYERPIAHIIVFEKGFDDVILRAKDTYNAIAKKLLFNAEDAKEAEKRKGELVNKQTFDRNFLLAGCVESFKEGFIVLAHIKMYKIIIDASLRFGSFNNFSVLLILFDKGKDSKIIQSMIKAFAEKDKLEFYGTKEQLNDVEDFFPFVYTTYQMNI